jgi:peptide/nickel transport system permease protein
VEKNGSFIEKKVVVATDVQEEIGKIEEGEEISIARKGEEFYLAGQWQLIWWKFKKHKLGVVSAFLIALAYIVALFADFLSPYTLEERDVMFGLAPPQRVHFFEGWRPQRPFVYKFKRTIDPNSLRRIFTEDKSQKTPILFFVHGSPYKFLGLWEADLHLFGVEGKGATIFLFGSDRLGRDIFSRVLYGARISLSVGLVGLSLSFLFGIILGGISGYYGGVVDNVIQRAIDIIRSFPTIPLWMALSAALPPQWSPLMVYFGITIILSFIGWTGLARVVRGKLLALREEDYAMAARLAGVGEWRIITRHLIPGFASHLIVSLTLALPNMILAETALSFLGLGLRPPVVSWGVLLKEAQNVRTVAQNPWLMMPVFFVIIVILAFNFVGDAIRDAADPYAR